MGHIIFLGPSFPLQEIYKLNLKKDYHIYENYKDILSHKSGDDNIIFLPPVAGGNITYILNSDFKVSSLSIIDGYFESTTSVWHKEILFALSLKIPVYGASSMGALRASELSIFGMIGIGKVYAYYESEEVDSDDEVAIIHAPRIQGYATIKEALINIRYNLQTASEAGIINNSFKNNYFNMAQEVFYKYRDYGFIAKRGIDRGLFQRNDFEKFAKWLELNREDIKYNDAVELITHIDIMKTAITPPDFQFEDTSIWRENVIL